MFWVEQFSECDLPEMFCSGRRAIYRASCEGGVCTNCIRNDDGSIHFIFNKHRLGKGVLHWEPHFELPNDIYPDGLQDLFSKEPFAIELVDGPGDCPTEAEIDVMLPYIKGEPFRYEDFTPEQIEGLQKPATDAADKLDEFVTEAKRAEKERETAETDRGKAEETRRRNESVRISSETAREQSEATREDNETARQDAETLREQAEQERMTEFAIYRPIIDSKQDALNTSEDLVISETNVLSLTKRAKQRLFDDMWLKAVGGYGTVDHTHYNDDGTPSPYYLNELWLTYDEALAVYNSYLKGVNQNEGISHFNVKTNIPVPTQWSTDLTRYAQGNIYLQTLRLPVVLTRNSMQAFYGCTNLRKIMGLIHLHGDIDNAMLYDCRKLEYVGISRLKSNLNLQWSPLINKECLTYLGTNANNTTPITITVHPDVYAKLTGDTINEAAASLTPEELAQWQKLVSKANSKNISFATV